MTILKTMRERFAELAHIQWSGWMIHLFNKSIKNEDGSVTIPAKLVTRWEQQSSTPYFNLPEDERKSDLSEADRVLAILVHWFWR